MKRFESKWASRILSLRIVLIYASFGSLWIIFSDLVLEELQLPDSFRFSIMKGILFIAITSLLLYSLMRRDMRQLIQVQSKLSESEIRYRLLFDSNPLPMWVFDSETLRFLAVNPASIQTYGYSREEFLSMTIRDIRPKEDEAVLTHYLETTNRYERHHSGVWRHRKKNGTFIDVEIISESLDFEGRPARLVLANDVTEKQRIARELTDNRTQIAAIIESAMDAIITISEDQRIILFNSAAQNMFKCSREDAIGQPIERFIPQRFRSAHRGHIHNFGQTGVTSRHMGALGEISGIRSNDEEFPIEASISQVEIGGAKFYTVILRDESVRKQQEEAIRQFSEELEQRVIDRTAELTLANKDLESFSYTVSHDLRAPLRAIEGFANILLEDHFDHLDAEAKRLLKVISTNVHQMSMLIDDLLTFARLSRQSIEIENVPMHSLAESVGEWFIRHDPRYDNSELRIDPLPDANGDQAMLKQVWQNLIGNAFKFSSVRERPIIEIGAFHRPNEWVYYVRDNGVGFDSAYTHKLFGVFQRLHSAHEFEGTGVGLAIVHRIIEKHGGSVWAESALNKNAAFYFSLPSHKTS
ncbi:PAS domain S-box protein [bacterium]|nr:PAS domain S-box protein [bacterium]